MEAAVLSDVEKIVIKEVEKPKLEPEADGKIDIKNIVSHTFNFKDIDKAMKFTMNNKEKVVKALIKL